MLARGVPVSKITVIHNSVPRRRKACDNGAVRDPRKVIYVGQVIPEKGVDILLEAVGTLVRRGHDVRLAIVGTMDGWVAPEYEGYRDRLRGSSDRARPVGEGGVSRVAATT